MMAAAVAATLDAVRCVGLATHASDLRLQLRADCHQNARGDGRLDGIVTVNTRWAARQYSHRGWAARQYSHSGHTMGG